MALSSTEIANLTLGHLGVTDVISDLATERSEEARTIRRFYQRTLERLARAYDWPQLRKIRALDLVESDPNSEWDFSYRYPSDCLQARKILSGIRNDSRGSRVPYQLSQDTQGKLIYSDKEDAELQYTIKPDNVDLFSADLGMAFSFLLGFYTAPSLTGGDPFKLGDRCQKMYLFELGQAGAQAANEEQPDEEPQADSLNARN